MIGRAVEALTEQIRQANDIVDVVGSYVSVRRAGRVFKALCPFHNEKTPSFHINPEKQIFKCFGCGAGGDVFKFIQRRENVGFVEAKAILAARVGISLEPEKSGPTGITKAELDRVNRWAQQWFARQLAGPGGAIAREYATGRGFSDASVARFELGFAPDGWDSLIQAAAKQRIPTELLKEAGLIKIKDDGPTRQYDGFRNRLMFPIRDPMNRIIGFGGRTLGDDPAKYINSPQNALFDKSRCLFGVHIAKGAFDSARQAVVVEGYMDCLLLQQAGIENVVATLGTALTADHVQMLRRYVDGVILVFDSDEAGRRAADRALEVALAGDLEIRLAQVPTGKDPADYVQSEGPEAFRTVLTSAIGALECKWNQVLTHRRSNSGATDQRRALDEFMGLISASGSLQKADPIRKGLILNQLGKLLGLPADEINRNLALAARRQSSRSERPDDSVAVGPPSRVEGGAASVATLHLLEVLLNEPSYFDSVSRHFVPDRLAHPMDANIAASFIEYVGETEQFELSEFISRFESIETAQRVTDLHLAGADRGNFGGTVEGAVARLEQLNLQGRGRQLLSTLSRPAALASGADGRLEEAASAEGADRDVFLAASEVVRSVGHFSARRHRGEAGRAPAATRESD